MLQALKHVEVKVRRQACQTLSAICKHAPHLAGAAVAAGIFPPVLVCMQDGDAVVRKYATCVVREVVKHSEELAGAAAAAGAVHSLLEYMTTRARGSDRCVPPAYARAPHAL